MESTGSIVRLRTSTSTREIQSLARAPLETVTLPFILSDGLCSRIPIDPTRVGKFVCAVSRGLVASGIAPSAKHFPGHGDTHVDSHLGLPRILKSLDELRQVELVPFRSLIAEDIATIMTGHMALPKITGSDIPCSLSRDITTLLRDDLGFKGVVVTDCL